ncbi:MAG TPA: hypothetical protein VFQ53_25700 [Kofleriaceae bacterium]|nr:hypothetical protein [Kofleriaceae bacterium]
MSSRVGGAALALVAVMLLALSILTNAWWSGHPEIDGREVHRKEVHIGMLRAQGCDVGESVADSCQRLPLESGFVATKYIELTTSAALGIALIALGILAGTGSKRRRVLAKVVMATAGACTIVAIALLVQGPDIKTGKRVAIPIGYGLFMFWGSIAMSFVAGAFAMRRSHRPSKAKLPQAWIPDVAKSPAAGKPFVPGLAPAPAPQPQVDVLALLQEDALRPSSLGPEPKLGRTPPSPGGSLPGPSGPLGSNHAPAPNAPLFSSAPQLRPLYEAPGGGGIAPVAAAPSLPARGPTPLPVGDVDALLEARTLHGGATAPRKPPTLPPPMPGARKPSTLPPPLRAKTNSAAPPLAFPPRAPTAAPPKTIATPAVPPPPNIPLPPSLRPSRPSQPARPETDDGSETVEHLKQNSEITDAEGLAEPDRFDALPTEARRPSAPLLAPLGEATDANMAIGDATSPSVAVESGTGSHSFSSELHTQIDDGKQLDAQTPPLFTISGDDTDDVVETRAREKFELGYAKTDLNIPSVTHAALRASAQIITSAPKAAKTPAPKLPISTAPDSLPPPTEKQTASSGPSPACPQCESPMAWVEEHLRFYCKSCRMYF